MHSIKRQVNVIAPIIHAHGVNCLPYAISPNCFDQLGDLICGSGSSRSFQSSSVPLGRRSAKIAGRKSTRNALKANIYGRIAKQVLQAAKQGGLEPESNARLKELLSMARTMGVPKDIIDRNLKKASDKDQADFIEVVYEAYGPASTGYVIECLTDNTNRALGAVRQAVAKSGGRVAEKGSVLFNFQRLGQILVPDPGSEDKLYSVATEAGAQDIETIYGDDEEAIISGFKVLTTKEDFAQVRGAIREASLPIDEEHSGLIYQSLERKEVAEESLAANAAMLEKLLSADDVDRVYSNCAGLH